MTRIERLIVLASFIAVLFVLLGIAGAIGALGAPELVLIVVLAIPLSVALSRFLRARVVRRPRGR